MAPPITLTTIWLLQKATTLKACQPAQGSSTDKWLPRGTAVPTQHHKSGPICFEKWRTNIFKNCSQPLCKAGERAYTCQNDSKPRSTQKHGRGCFSVHDNAITWHSNTTSAFQLLISHKRWVKTLIAFVGREKEVENPPHKGPLWRKIQGKQH